MEPTIKLYKKLLAVQSEVGGIVKDSDNPYFHSKYFDIKSFLETVKPILTKHGLVLLQPLAGTGLITKIIDAETGESIESGIELPQNPDPQKSGSIVSYFRRYSLQSLLALHAVDDDANEASGKVVENGNGKVCPDCGEAHNGKYARCIECWKKSKQESF